MGGTAPLSLPTEPCHASELLFSIHHQFYSCTKATQHTHEKIDIFIYINIYWASYQCLSTSGLVCAADSWLLLLSGLLSMENAACVVVAGPPTMGFSLPLPVVLGGWLVGWLAWFVFRLRMVGGRWGRCPEGSYEHCANEIYNAWNKFDKSVRGWRFKNDRYIEIIEISFLGFHS